jgi:FkbM family methyltransferase
MPPALVRAAARRTVRAVLRMPGTERLRLLAARVPFSRYHITAYQLFNGEVIIDWAGGRAQVDPGEVHGYYPYFFGHYATEEIDVLVTACRTARVFFDVGANRGLLTLAIARACPDLCVVAFEPEPRIAELLRVNVALNADLHARIRIEESALGGFDGVCDFESSDHASNAGVGRLATRTSTGPTNAVHVETLASFVERTGLYPDVVKLDIEGSELEVLRSMASIRWKPATLLVETHELHRRSDGDFNSRLLAEFHRLGYELHRLRGAEWLPVVSATDLGPRAHVLATLSQS